MSDTLSRAEVDALLAANNGSLSLAAFVKAMSAKRDDYDLRAIAYAREAFASEGELEIDENALTSRADDDDGCYVMAWRWASAFDGDWALAPAPAVESRRYFVQWEVEMDATSPQEAAESALKQMRDPASTATAFTVTESVSGEQGDLVVDSAAGKTTTIPAPKSREVQLGELGGTMLSMLRDLNHGFPEGELASTYENVKERARALGLPVDEIDPPEDPE